MNNLLLHPIVIPGLLTAAIIFLLIQATKLAERGTIRSKWLSNLASPGLWTGITIVLVSALFVGAFSWIIFGKLGREGLILYFFVILGILAKWVFEAVNNRDRSKPIQLDFVDLLVPLVISFLVFGYIVDELLPTTTINGQSVSEQTTLTPKQIILPYLTAFQNGFFWQAAYDVVSSNKTQQAIRQLGIRRSGEQG